MRAVGGQAANAAELRGAAGRAQAPDMRSP